ncbi:PadR family transcriptional regulator [Jeotgalibacillus sp. S-D1]|uniref:PadR family transcriptional regulator n=1 Tax=Jeotgalibacillus sp. S-D1 TaxID=2552189 RepID=UPI001059F259|nr:PadR family transcriptional regulator [Jeotgalibacillus sp. S-D1]TDL32682.1 PadR family transcriptional regulator [Jeotgalibacillus sp. S-D1]
MEDRLKRLKKSMDSSFEQLNFSAEHRKKIHEKINQTHEIQNDPFVPVLQLLITEKTGYELTQLLRARGIRRFENNEGSLYTLLHRLEQKEMVQSSFDRSGDKYYQVTEKGRKALQKEDKSMDKKAFALKKLLQG